MFFKDLKINLSGNILEFICISPDLVGSSCVTALAVFKVAVSTLHFKSTRGEDLSWTGL